jgi:lysophospholipase L1-like esterase
MLKPANPNLSHVIFDQQTIMKILLLNIIHLVISPLYFIALPQGLRLKRSAIRMPEAQGPRSMSLGLEQVNKLKLLYLGESPAAGVGIEEIKYAVSAQVAYKLAQTQNVEWQLLAQNGIKIKELLIKLQQTETHKPDISIITMGVNDCTNLTSNRQWKAQLINLIAELKSRGCQRIFFTAVPPMLEFPLLPAPLSWIMGYRAHVLNHLLEQVCQQHDAQYLAFSAVLLPEMICPDGYHPNKKGAELWAQSISQQIIPFIQAD